MHTFTQSKNSFYNSNLSVEVLFRVTDSEWRLWRWLSHRSVTTNNSPSQDYTNQDDQPITNIYSPGSQPTTALLRITPIRTINQLQTFTHLGHNQQLSSSGLHQSGRSTNYKHLLTWVTTNNSPSQDTNPDDQPIYTNICSHGFRPFTVLRIWGLAKRVE